LLSLSFLQVVVGKSRRLEGVIRYFGEVMFSDGDWVGIELEKPGVLLTSLTAGERGYTSK